MKHNFLEFVLLTEAWTVTGEHDKSVEKEWATGKSGHKIGNVLDYITPDGHFVVDDIDKIDDNMLQSIISKLATSGYKFSINGTSVSLPSLPGGLKKIKDALLKKKEVMIQK